MSAQELSKGVISSEQPIIQQTAVSFDLAQALQLASNKVSEEGIQRSMNTDDLFYALSTSQGKAAYFLKALAGLKLQNVQRTLQSINTDSTSMVEVTLGDTKQMYSHEVLDLIQDARVRFAIDNPITTDHLVLSDLTRPNSNLARIFEKEGVNVLGAGSDETDTRTQFVNAVHARIQGEEEGSIPMSFSYDPREVQTINQEPYIASQETAKPLEEITPPAYDLIRRSKDGKMNELFIRERSVMGLLQSVEQYGLSVVVSDQKDEVDSIVSGLAQQLGKDKSGVFPYRCLIAVDPVALELNPVQTIRQALTAAEGGILYLPDIQKYLSGVTQSGYDIGQDLRVAVAKKTVKLVSTLTEKQWHTVYQREEFARAGMFMPDPATIEEAKTILIQKKAELEQELSTATIPITISNAAIANAVELSNRYVRESHLPGSAAELIKRAATEIKAQFARLAASSEEELPTESQVDPKDIVHALERFKNISIASENPERYLKMEEELGKGIIGQPEAVKAVSGAIRRAQAGLNDPNRPIGSFMFLGPTGVGKTELSKKLSEFLFDDEEGIIRLDMSEYREESRVSQLIGAPPGYVGYEEGGHLTEKVRKKPYSVVVFDEIEKAHPAAWNMLLQVMEEGTLTDNHGRHVDFRNTVIIMTSNVGAEYFSIVPEVLGKDSSEEEIRSKTVEEVEKSMGDTFRPEFLNRIDEKVVFNTLKLEHIETIVGIQVNKVNKKLKNKGIDIKVTPSAQKYLAKQGYEPANGARPVRRVVTKFIEDPLTMDILGGKYKSGDTMVVDMDGDTISLTKEGNESIT